MRGRRGKPVRLAVWLTALVLVPLTAIGYQLFVTASQRSDTVTRSRVVETGANQLVQVVGLGVAVIRERMPTAFVLSGVNTKGLTLEQASAALGGGHLNEDIGNSRATTDRALAVLGNSLTWTADVRQVITTAREAVDDPALRANGAGTRAASRVREAQKLIESQVLTQIAQLQKQVAGLPGDTATERSLRRDLDSVQESFQLMVAFADEGAAAFALGGISDGVELASAAYDTPITSPRITMVVSNANYKNLSRALRENASGEIATRLAQVVASGDSQLITGYFDQYAAVLSTSTADRIVRKIDFDLTAFFSRIFLSGGVRHLQALSDVVTVSGEQVGGDAHATRRAADRSYQQILLIALGVVVMALLGVALLSRLVTHPLAEVAARARRISGGSLEAVAVTGGPREVVEVSRAFDDVAQNLRLLQAQADALAAGDTGHPSLQQTVPGALGTAMQASVGRLSASLEARSQLEGQLRHESTHDGLTGLLNRAAAMVALENGLARANRAGGGLGVLHINVDRLHAVNDIAGPTAGDDVLRAVAGTISAAVRNGDVVARLGADEFVVVAETTSVDLLMELSRRIIDRLAEVSLAEVTGSSAARLRDAGLPAGIGASAGVVVAFDGLHDAASLLRDAATAVRAAKRRGGGQIELLDDDLREVVERRQKVHEGLRQALDAGDLTLNYQPIVDMHGQTVGVEALARWTSAELGIVSPDVFVAAAESSDLVLELDRWVLKEALSQLAGWDAAGDLPGIYLSVNISGRHLGDHRLVEDVTSALHQSGVAPERLLLEITETVLLSDISVAARELSELRALGMRVAVDDFGTGYTSISHLQQLPVDLLKIDRSFIVGMSQERGRTLVRMMVEMAAALGLSVVAEGVETPGELEALREMGCPLVQGFLLGRPATPDLVADRVTPQSRPAREQSS